MKILQVLNRESEMILLLMIVVFLRKELLNLSARSSAEAKCGRFIVESLSVKFLVNLKSLF